MNQLKWLFTTSSVSAAALVQLLLFAACAEAQTTNWILGTGSGNWFDGSHWDNGVPNSPGAVAQFPGNNLLVQLNQQATVGQLILLAPQSTTVFGTGSLIFDMPGTDPALIELLQSPSGAGTAVTITNPLAIAANESLSIDVDQPSSLSLNGAITSSSGDVTKLGLGSLTLRGASSNWGGQLSIAAGQVIVTNAAGLGAISGHTVVGTDGVLSLQVATLEPVDLNGGTLAVNSSSALALSNRIHLLGNGVVSDLSATAGVTLNNIIDGTGDVTFKNAASSAAIIAGNNTYTGHTYLSGTSFRATHANSFGDPAEGTTLQSGSLSVEVATDETFVVQNGTLTFSSALNNYNHAVTLDGGKLVLPSTATLAEPIVLEAGGGTVQFQSSNSSWTGGSTGTGNLKLVGTVAINAPLTHAGTLTVGPTTFNVADSYTGDTYIAGSSTLNNSGAFGTSPTVHIQQSSTLTMNAVPSNDPNFVIESGSIRINDMSRPINGDITFKGGSLPMLVGNTTYNGNIHVDVATGSAYLIGGTYNGVISGIGNVDMAQDSYSDTITAENTYTGTTRVNGTVNANSPHALGSWDRGTVVGNGTLNLNAPTDEPILVIPRGKVNVNATVGQLPQLAQVDSSLYRGSQVVALNVPGNYHQVYDVNEGMLQVNADTSIDAVVIRNGGSVIADGATLTTNSEINLQQGNIQGHISGAPSIRKTTNEYAHLGALPDFGSNIYVDKGVLQIDSNDALQSMAGALYVSGARDAVLQLNNSLTTSKPLYLNNATGVDETGGLYLARITNDTPTITLNGPLDLGSVGSVIGAGDNASTGQTAELDLNGPVSGGKLTTRGRWLQLAITSNQCAYAGATEIREGTLIVKGNGTLTSTSSIDLYEDSDYHDGMLVVDNLTSTSTNRIGDTIPFHMYGGVLRFDNPDNGHIQEAIGQMSFLEGSSTVDRGANVFTIAGVDRQAGATVRFDIGSNQTRIANAPTLINGIIPWMIVNDSQTVGIGFATSDNDGTIKQLSSYTPIGTASTNDNAYVASTQAITTDRIVNSVTFADRTTLDLGGHRLTVQTGGMLSEIGFGVTNGEITASGNHELLLYSADVQAQIVDDGTSPVSVTTTGSSVFRSANSYSGTTYVNEDYLYLLHQDGLPDGTNLAITGGEVRIGYTATAAKHLHNVRISGDGALTNLFTGERGQGIFSFDQVILEDGTLQPGQIVGGGQMIKQSLGVAAIVGTTGSTYGGDIVVQDGLLSVTGLPQAQFHVNSGTLLLPSGANDITLNGGTLDYVYLTSNITINSASRIIPEPQGTSSNYGLAGSFSGSGDLTFENRPMPTDPASAIADSAAYVPVALRGHSPSYSGNITIDSSTVSLTFADSLGTGDIHIRPDGTLYLAPQQSNLSTSKLDLTNTVYLDGGDLEGVSSVFQPQRLLGDLYVNGESYIGTLEVPGSTHLTDGSRLTTTQYLNTSFTGDVLVGGTVEFDAGRTFVRSSALQADRAVVQLGARLVSDAPVAVLNIENAGLDDLVLPTSFVVQNNQTLAINYRGKPIELSVSGGTISGGGTLLNPIRVDQGGRISPGNSPGTLSFANSLTLGPAAVYDWEINNAMGAAGDPSGWDLLHVDGPLTFTATPAEPLVIRVIGLDALPLANFADPDLSDKHRWLIATASAIAGFDLHSIVFQPVPSSNPVRSIFAQQFTVETEGANLFLVFQVPEPSGLAMCLAAIGFIAGGHLRRR